jgi:tRNA A-37 threonylcarbamoyl transferase component Bud32
VLSGLELRDALLGTVIDGPAGVRYHIREVLGEGGQGWVFKANYGEPHGFWVVVKVLRPESVQTEALQRFEREAKVLRQLASVASPNPNIVRFYDYGCFVASARGKEVELPFIALEHVDGQTLAGVLRSHGGFGLPIARARRVMRQVARALHAVHEQRIVHRDLKPSNVMLAQTDGQEIVKVTDFGLVKLPDLTAHRTISIAGASLGYAPPEQYEMGNHRVGAQTDVFSFASVLFEVLSGTEAFPLRHGDSPLRVVARMLTGDRPSLARVHATVPRELRERADLTAALDVEIGRALNADPGVRQASIRELWEQVEPLLDEAMGAARPLDESATFATPAAPRVALTTRAPAFRVVGHALTGEKLRAAAIAADRHAVVAIGVHGLYRFADGVWSTMQLPLGVAPRAVRGLGRTARGELLVYGEGGLAVIVSRGGAAERVAIGDRDLTLLGGLADEQGLLFAGERTSRPGGVLVDIPRNGSAVVRTIEGTARLHGVARLAGGALILCGTHGALQEVSGGEARAIPWGRTGHLYAVVAASDGGAFTVGSGGHALRVSPPAALPGLSAPPSATLEAVQTTRDLGSVVLDDDGVAWAVGGQARLLQRRNSVWARIPVDAASEGRLIAVRPRRDGVTLLVENGTVLDGSGALEPAVPPATSSRSAE